MWFLFKPEKKPIFYEKKNEHIYMVILGSVAFIEL
jgi:hypothetical protein